MGIPAVQYYIVFLLSNSLQNENYFSVIFYIFSFCIFNVGSWNDKVSNFVTRIQPFLKEDN